VRRLVRRLVILLLAKILRRRIARLVRHWLARRVRRVGSSLARASLRRGARGAARRVAWVLGRSPARQVSIGKALILRLLALAEALDDGRAPRGTA